MDASLQAQGTLYLDDGDSLDSVAMGNYSLYNLTASRNGMSGRVSEGQGHLTSVRLNEVAVYGLGQAPLNITVNNVTASFQWIPDTEVSRQCRSIILFIRSVRTRGGPTTVCLSLAFDHVTNWGVSRNARLSRPSSSGLDTCIIKVNGLTDVSLV